jgi:hypothetical protein
MVARDAEIKCHYRTVAVSGLAHYGRRNHEPWTTCNVIRLVLLASAAIAIYRHYLYAGTTYRLCIGNTHVDGFMGMRYIHSTYNVGL